ncbi:MAG: hypothetical protein IJE69_07570 [Alistipes sp.]|nr:hypothetical protein [Alistipes sp.]
MKKIFYLMLLCATMGFLNSCEKSEENQTDKVLTDVDGTRWLAVNDDDSFELSFDNGRYTLSCVYDGRRSGISGTYSQNNRKIQFEEKDFITYTYQRLKTGEISQYGSSITVPVYNNNLVSKDVDYILKFTLMLE